MSRRRPAQISAGSLRAPLSRWAVCLWAFCLWAVPAATSARAEVKVEAQVDPPSATLGEQVILTVTVDGAVNLDQGPVIPPVEGLEIQGAGQSTNISIVNGHMSRSVTFQYIIFGRKSGSFDIGPCEVRDGGKIYRSSTVHLDIGGGGGSRSPAPSGAGTAMTPSGRPEEPEPEERGDLFVRTEVDREHVALGEQVTLRFQFFQRLGYPLTETPQYNPPTSEGFWREDLPPQRTSTRTVRGITYQVTELVYALFPTQDGRLTIGEGTLDCTVRDRGGSRDPFSIFGGFFSEKQVRLRSKPITVRVDPLPSPRPADFTGGVGSYTLQSSLDRREVAQNEPVTLTLTVAGEGNVSTVGDPKLPTMVGLRTYQSSSDVKTEHAGDRLRGKKSFSVVLVPETTGRHEIPPIGLSVYDVDQHRYTRLESPALSLNVLPARAGGSSADGGEVTRVGRDLRTIRTSTQLRSLESSRPWARTGFWLLQVVPLLFLAAAFAWRLRSERREADWGAVLSRGAAGRYRRDLAGLRAHPPSTPAQGFDRLDAALERYLTDRFHLPVRGLTRDEVFTRLRESGVAEESIASVRTVAERCDFARFAPQALSAGDLLQALDEAARLPEILEKRRPQPGPTLPLFLALAVGLSFALAGAARAESRLTPAQADAAFRQGNEAYGRGDYRAAAREYGRVLVAGYESPELLLDLGNASYRLGRLGWAVYYFQRGRSLAPQDPDLRINLDLAQQESKDKVPEIDSSRFLSWLVRLQDRTSLAGGLRWSARLWWLLVLFASILVASSGGGSARGALAASRPARLAGVALGLLFLASVGWTGMKALQLGGGPGAVVVADELTVRSNPDAGATVEFTLHAGTRVRLGRTMGGFREVLFSEKLRGWGPAEDLADLDATGAAALYPEDADAILGAFAPR